MSAFYVAGDYKTNRLSYLCAYVIINFNFYILHIPFGRGYKCKTYKTLKRQMG